MKLGRVWLVLWVSDIRISLASCFAVFVELDLKVGLKSSNSTVCNITIVSCTSSLWQWCTLSIPPSLWFFVCFPYLWSECSHGSAAPHSLVVCSY
jgi:hypothetical protein